jgi:hypothetical protein
LSSSLNVSIFGISFILKQIFYNYLKLIPVETANEIIPPAEEPIILEIGIDDFLSLSI